MERTASAPVGIRRPGRTRAASSRVRRSGRRVSLPGGVRPCGRAREGRDRGAVTVESAFGILALVAVLSVLAWCLGLLVAQLAVGEAARAAARVVARGEDLGAARDEAQRLLPDAVVEVHHDLDHVVVDVSRSVSPPGALARWGSVRLSAESVALVEQGS
jgi:hypothetical protein